MNMNRILNMNIYMDPRIHLKSETVARTTKKLLVIYKNCGLLIAMKCLLKIWYLDSPTQFANGLARNNLAH